MVSSVEIVSLAPFIVYRRRGGCRHRSPALLHDDARRAKTELVDYFIDDAGGFSRKPSYPPGVSAIDRQIELKTTFSPLLSRKIPCLILG